MLDDNVQLLVTGKFFLGKGIRSIETVSEELIKKAKREIQIATYVLSIPNKQFERALENAVERGIDVKIIVNDFENDDHSIKKIEKLAMRHRNIKIFKFKGMDDSILHTKIIVIDRRAAFVGSANLTWRGLTKNHEIGVVLEGKSAEQVADLVDCITGTPWKSQRVAGVR